MAIPSNVGHGTVVWTAVDSAGEPIQGWVSFTPVPARLLDGTSDPDPVTILPKPRRVDLVEGALSEELIATDDPDLNPVGWTYRVQFGLVNVRLQPFYIEVPEGSVVDLTTVMPVASDGGVTIIRGPAGASTVEAEAARDTAVAAADTASAAAAAADEDRIAAEAAAAAATAAPGIIDAKGDLIVGIANDTAARLAVGANGRVLLPDSTQTSGWRFSTTALFEGTGFPEGVVTAPVGSRYIDTAATNGAVEWIKASGTGTTGWKVVYGDTGARTLTPDAGWTIATGGPIFTIRRVGDRVDLVGRLNPAGATVGTARNFMKTILSAVPTGFSITGFVLVGSASRNGGGLAGVLAAYAVGQRLDIQIGTETGTWGSADVVGVRGSWHTNDQWPSTLPGTPVA